MREESAALAALPEEEKESEENKIRLKKVEEKFHTIAHRRHVLRDAAKERAEKEGRQRFAEDKPERERQKEAERMRQKQKGEEEQEKREREKVQGIRDRIEALERKKDWKETMEEAKITGGERYRDEEREKGREDEGVIEEEWQAIAATFNVLLPAVYVHIPESLDFIERHACKVDRAGNKFSQQN